MKTAVWVGRQRGGHKESHVGFSCSYVSVIPAAKVSI